MRSPNKPRRREVCTKLMCKLPRRRLRLAKNPDNSLPERCCPHGGRRRSSRKDGHLSAPSPSKPAQTAGCPHKPGPGSASPPFHGVRRPPSPDMMKPTAAGAVPGQISSIKKTPRAPAWERRETSAYGTGPEELCQFQRDSLSLRHFSDKRPGQLPGPASAHHPAPCPPGCS